MSSTHLSLPSSHFPRGFPTKILYVLFVSPIQVTCLAQCNFLDFTILIMLGYLHKSQNSWLCILNCLQTSSLGPYIFLNNSFSNTCNLISTDKTIIYHTLKSFIIILTCFITNSLRQQRTGHCL